MLNCSYFLSSVISRNEFIIGSLIVLILLSGVLLSIAEGRFDNILVGLIVGSSFVNIAERVLFGCVKDYFDFFGLFSFNLADVAITIGVLTLMWKKVIQPLKLK